MESIALIFHFINALYSHSTCPVFLVISSFSLLCSLTLHPISLHSLSSACPRHFSPIPTIPNERHLSSPNERVHYSSDSWEQRAAGRGMDDKRKRQNRSEGDAWYPPMAMDCKTLPLPPPLAVFFLIASWAISGSFKMGAPGWRHWRGRGGVILCVCLCECVFGEGEGEAFGPAEAMNKHSDRQQDRDHVWKCVFVCVHAHGSSLCCCWRQEKRCKTHMHTQTHTQTQMWNH